MRNGKPFPAFVRPSNAAKARDWYQIRNAADDDTAEILIYDEIGDSWWGGVSAKDFVKDITAVDADKIDIRINSPGGDVFDGIAIMNAIKAHKATVRVIIDGLAASAASFIAMAGDEIVIRRNAEMMIHDPSGFCYGNAADMKDLAEQLDRIGTNIATMYADRAGGSADDWRDLMLAETWYSAEEAVTAGLADRVDSGDNDEKKTKDSFDLSFFAYAGRQAAKPPPIAAPTTSAERAGDNQKKENTVAFSEELAKRLGLESDATEEELVAALDAQSGESTTTETGADGTGEGTEAGGGESTGEAGAPVVTEQPANKAAAAATAPETVTLDKGAYEQYVANNARLQQFLDKQATDHRNTVIDNALRAGKIVAATAQDWRDAHQADPSRIEKILDTMPAGQAVPVGEIGHGQDGNGGAENLVGDAHLEQITSSDAYKNWKF